MSSPILVAYQAKIDEYTQEIASINSQIAQITAQQGIATDPAIITMLNGCLAYQQTELAEVTRNLSIYNNIYTQTAATLARTFSPSQQIVVDSIILNFPQYTDQINNFKYADDATKTEFFTLYAKCTNSTLQGLLLASYFDS